MTIRSMWCCFAAVALACGGGSTEPDSNNNNPPGPTKTNVVGRTDRTIAVGGQQRSFVVYVGSTVGATTTAPVVIMFHGTSGDGPQFFDQSGWRQQADQEGLIAVFPTALVHCFHEDENDDGDFLDFDEHKVTTKWAHGALGDPTIMPLCTAQQIAALSAQNRALVDHPLADDLAFMDAMIAFLKQNYLIDEKAIYATGFSNGAQFANRLAVERNQVFAATAAHAGGTGVTPIPGRAISVVETVGTLDDRYTTRMGVTEIPMDSSALTQLPLLRGIFVTPMLQQLRLTIAYTFDEPIINGKKTARWTFRTSQVGGNNSLIFTLLDDNFHTYPNGSGYPIVMANVLWNFFKTQRLP